MTGWHADRRMYEEEAIGNARPGFCKQWNISSDQIKEADLLCYEDFRHVLYKWHVKLYKAFSKALESKEYMRNKNTIIVLTRIVDYFPLVRRFGVQLEKLISAKMEDEREDLKILASR